MPTVIRVEEDEESRRGGGDITTGDSYEERTFKVYFSDKTANSIDARNANGVPVWGAALGSYSLYVLKKDAETDKNDRSVWIVKVTYRTLQAFEQQPRFDALSGKWNIVKSCTGYPTERPIQKDVNGKVLENCMGEPYNPPITDVIYDWKFTISFLTDAVDQPAIDACLGKSNSAIVYMNVGGVPWTFPIYTLKLLEPAIQETFDSDGNLIASVTFTLLYRADTWKEKRPNLSRLHLVPGTARIGPILESDIVTTIGTGSNFTPVSEPQYLTNATGQIIPGGGTVETKDYDIIAQVSYGTLLDDIA